MEEARMTKAERKAWKKEQKKIHQHEEWQKTKRRGLLVKLIVAAVVGLGLFGIITSGIPIPQNEKNKSVEMIEDNDWYKGKKEALVTIIVYSDFQCPSCALVAPYLEEVSLKYPEVGITYRHFPLRQIHLQAEAAAWAAEAAGKQARFWEMHDLLFQKQKEWSGSKNITKLLSGYAQEIGLDLKQFNQDYSSKEVKGLVKADYTSAIENGLSSTPTLFINGKRMAGIGSRTELFSLIENELVEATKAAEITK